MNLSQAHALIDEAESLPSRGEQAVRLDWVAREVLEQSWSQWAWEELGLRLTGALVRLVRRLTEDPDQTVRRGALDALGSLEIEEAATLLQQVADDLDDPLRDQARAYLGQSSSSTRFDDVDTEAGVVFVNGPVAGADELGVTVEGSERTPHLPRGGRPPTAPDATDVYPLLDCRPCWVTCELETIRVGLTPKYFQSLVGVGNSLLVQKGSFTVTLLLDPESIVTADGQERCVSLEMAAGDLAPWAEVGLVARSAVGLNSTRRIGVLYQQGGRTIGLAWRHIAVVDTVEERDAYDAPDAPVRSVDLSVLLEEDPPDLVVTAHPGDTSGTDLVWEAFSANPRLITPDPERRGYGGVEAAAELARNHRSAVTAAKPGEQLYDDLCGLGSQVAAAIPDGIRELLDSLAQASKPPTVLLLTDEVVVPWELAIVGDEADDAASPFLGARVALSRWPLDATRLTRDVNVVKGAVVAVEPETNQGLAAAVSEASRLCKERGFEPVTPTYDAVEALLRRGQPAAQLVHLALHGSFDAGGAEDGIQLPDPPAEGPPPADASARLAATRTRLSPRQVGGWHLPHRPFVFVNACLVGSGDVQVGQAGGFATALLRAGAVATVAATTTVNDEVAARVAHEFYNLTMPSTVSDGEQSERVGAAEALRRIRSGYTRTASASRAEHTVLAYQLFGHPCLQLRPSSPPTTPEENP